jgi:integrase
VGTFFEALSDYKFSGPKEDLIIRILEEYNCRVSEILLARWVNFYPDKYLILPGLKRSRSICVRDKAILSLISELPRHNSEFIFKPISYQRIYTLCNRLLNDKVNKYKKRKNKKVTHFFRYENVAQLDNDKIIQDILHHNSARSSGYYKTKQKGSSNEK